MGDSLRTSSYTIYVDLPARSDEVLLVHGYSGAYDLVSADVANFVRSCETRKAPKPLYGDWTPDRPASHPAAMPADQTVSHLMKRGYLTSLSELDEEAFFVTVVEALHDRAMTEPPAYIWMVTYDCNLRCGYCFQDHMRTDPAYGHLLNRMDRPMVDRILRGTRDIERSHGVADDDARPRSIVFFGGEPLLPENRDVVEYVMDRARNQFPVGFSAITNGTHLDAYEDLLGPDRISSVQITLDGPPHVHDERRIHPDGSGSFASIAKNVTLALNRGTYVEVRTNVDRLNVDLLPEFAASVIAERWQEFPNFVAYAAPIAPSNDKTDTRITMTSWELDKRLDDLRESCPDLFVLHRPDDGLARKIQGLLGEHADPFALFKSAFCAAHGRMYVFDPFGDMYACWEKTGDRRIRIGHIADDGTVESALLRSSWRGRTVASNPVCRRCRFALYCGGGCAVRALGRRGTMYANHCDGFAARFRSSVADAYLAHEDSPEGTPAGADTQSVAPC
jgi:uncharacterized protein